MYALGKLPTKENQEHYNFCKAFMYFKIHKSKNNCKIRVNVILKSYKGVEQKYCFFSI